AALGAQAMVCRPTDAVAEAELRNGVGDSFWRGSRSRPLGFESGGAHAAPLFSGEAAHEKQMGASRRRRNCPAPTRKAPTVHCLAYRRRKPFALYTADPLDGRTTAYMVASSEAGGPNDPPLSAIPKLRRVASFVH